MKLYIEPVSIILGVLVISGALSDYFEKKEDRKQITQLIDTNVKQAGEVVKMAGNVQQQAGVIDKLVLDQKVAEEKYQTTLKDKDKKTGEQLGILATQAATIALSTPASDTLQHASTAEAFMKQSGGVKIDSGLAWNGAYVQQNIEEMALLKKLLDQEKAEKDRVQAQLASASNKNLQLADALVVKTIEHERTAGNIAVVNEQLSNKSTMMARIKSVLMWASVLGVILGLAYAAFHIMQIKGLKSKLLAEEARRREANMLRYEQEKIASELKTSVKTFLSVGPEGNEQMKAIIKANGLKKHFEDALEP